MINDYEIKKINNEEILILYFSLDSEFSKINFKDKKDNLEKIIKKFINDNKILFTGSLVALVVGGSLIGNINLDNHEIINTTLNKFTYIEPILTNITKLDESIIEIIKEEIEDNRVIIEEAKENKNIVDNKTNINSKNNPVLETKKEDSKNESTRQNIEIEEKQEEVDKKTYVKIKRSSGEILNIELEEYLIGVVSAEMPAEFQTEALKAQAVIARTYTLKSLSKGQMLTDNESTQSYKSNSELKKIWGNKYDTYYSKVENAVNSTYGKYLTYNGNYIEAVYHSTSNGLTENSQNVWGNFYPYLVSVTSEYDNLNPTYISDKIISYEELTNKIGIDINSNTNFEILGKTEGNRVSNIKVDDKIYSGVDFRMMLGLKSADFTFEKLANGIKFTTTGYGHGVGMSQYGANGMAKNGYNYEQILKHYYNGVILN